MTIQEEAIFTSKMMNTPTLENMYIFNYSNLHMFDYRDIIQEVAEQGDEEAIQFLLDKFQKYILDNVYQFDGVYYEPDLFSGHGPPITIPYESVLIGAIKGNHENIKNKYKEIAEKHYKTAWNDESWESMWEDIQNNNL